MGNFGTSGAVEDEVRAPAIKEELSYNLERIISSSKRNQDKVQNLLNPKARGGNILKCFKCNSVK